MAVILQFSLTPSRVGHDRKRNVFSFFDITDSVICAQDKPAEFIVVNGWRAPEGTVIHNHIRILSPGGHEVFDKILEDVMEKSLLVIAMKGDFELAEEGWHSIQVYNGEQLYLEYPMRFRRA